MSSKFARIACAVGFLVGATGPVPAVLGNARPASAPLTAPCMPGANTSNWITTVGSEGTVVGVVVDGLTLQCAPGSGDSCIFEHGAIIQSIAMRRLGQPRTSGDHTHAPVCGQNWEITGLFPVPVLACSNPDSSPKMLIKEYIKCIQPYGGIRERRTVGLFIACL